MSAKIRPIDISKILITVLIVYEQWYLYKFGPISNLLQILAVLIVIVTVCASSSSLIRLVKERTFAFWMVFGVTSLINAILFSSYTRQALSSLQTYFSFLIVCLCAGVVSVHDNSRSWFQYALIIVCVLCAYSTITSPYLYRNEGYYVITMSSLNNPNNLGFMMSIGIFALMLPEKKPKKIGWIIRGALALVFMYVIVNTGSRSSLLCGAAVLFLSLYFNYKFSEGTGIAKALKRVSIILVIIIGILFAIHMISKSGGSGNGLSRLLERFNRNAFSDRGGLYIIAWDIFKAHFLVGVGYDCFALFSGKGIFTHSTYMELLSCTGIVGTFLFLYPVIRGMRDAIASVREDNGNKLTILIMMLISGLFGITYYTIVFMMTLYLYLLPIKPDKRRA